MNQSDQDPFEAINNLNQNAYDSGFKEGAISGKKEAIKQGFSVGRTTSFNLAAELGHYYGLCDLYRTNHMNENDISSAQSPSSQEKTLKLANQICELIEKFDLVDCHNETFPTQLSQIRDKIKQFCSITNYKNYFNKELLNNVKLSF